MKIQINEEKYVEENSYDSYNYDLAASINIDESADATEVMGAICKAMIIEGYHIESIANAMYNYADYLAFQNNFKLKLDDE